MSFWEYELSAETLLIGECIKKGTFRPVVPTMPMNGYRPLPYSTAAGALHEFLGLSFDVPIHAAGYLTEGKDESLIISPRDNVTGVSKLPITIQYLSGVKGKMFILLDEYTNKLPEEYKMVMGGMRYKGFGLCHLKKAHPEIPVDEGRSKGKLLTRIPEEALTLFGIDIRVGQDGPYRWGYLFKPTSAIGGIYVKSLFEGSEVEAYQFLLEVKYESE